MSNRNGRGRLLVDPAFQFRLLGRMVVYLLVYTVVVFHIGFAFQCIFEIARDGLTKGLGALYVEFLAHQKGLLYAFVLVTPILLYDLLRFSNRVAGPLFRCRKVMHEMASGKPVPEFTPRKNDLMGELFASFNGLIRAWNTRVGPETEHSPPPAGQNGIKAAEPNGFLVGSRPQ